jgi:hypothetical protein
LKWKKKISALLLYKKMDAVLLLPVPLPFRGFPFPEGTGKGKGGWATGFN